MRYAAIYAALELWLDPALLHVHWEPAWNKCKHLLGTKIEVDATFVQSSKYRKHGNAWELVRWETTLSSRLAVQLPADFQQQLEAAKTTYRRFGDVAQISWRPLFTATHYAEHF